MRFKETIKTWLKALDEELKQDDEAKGAAAPSHSPRTSTPAKPLSPAAVSPTSASAPSPAQESKETVIIGTSDDLHHLLSHTNVQIDTPYRLEAGLLEPFLRGEKRLFLVSVQNGKVTPATLAAVHDTHLIADTEHSLILRHRGEHMLVVFPTLPQQYHVLQTVIEEVYHQRLKLRYQDPRYDVRHQVQSPIPVLLYAAPALITTALEQQHIRLVRDFALSATEGKALLTDRFLEKETTEVAPHMELFYEQPPWQCLLKDISLGGVCLLLPSTPQPPALHHCLVLLHARLPSGILDGTAVQLILEPLGIVRNIRADEQSWFLHIRFLKRLPEKLEELLIQYALPAPLAELPGKGSLA